jgi:hypothetical protein
VRAALGASGVLMAALAIGCGTSGPKNDHDALEELWKDYFGAIASGDVGDATRLYSSECGDISGQVEKLMKAFQAVREDSSFDVTGIEVQNNNGTTAETIPTGTITYFGAEQEMTSDAFTPVVKESGRWKFSNCDILGGGFFEPVDNGDGGQPQ